MRKFACGVMALSTLFVNRAWAQSSEQGAAFSDSHITTNRPTRYGKLEDWSFETYGYARLDAIEDSTQSFEDGIQPNLIARAGTYRGDHRRTTFTARDSRLGLFVVAPPYEGMNSYAQVEFDFFGIAPTDARRHDTVVFSPVRIRLAYFKLETSIVNVLAGQFHDLFGWGGFFYPATVAYLGVPGEIFHRNPQIRIEKALHLGRFELMAAVSAVRAGQRDSGLPEGQAGIKVAHDGWKGVAMQGFNRKVLLPLSVGVSGLYRRFEAPAFRSEPGSESVQTFGYGLAASLLVPIVRPRGADNRSNALTVTGEISVGSGIADMYTFMDGGSRFPLLPNPSLAAPAIQYPSNVDPGLVTFDRTFALKAINWRAVVAGLQYYLPIDNGRIWFSGIYSRTWSDNIKALTPAPSWGGIFTKMEYFDAGIGVDITPAVILGLSYQTVKQTFGDVSAPTPIYGEMAGVELGIPTVPGTGGVAAHATNHQAQLSMSLLF